MSTIPSPLTVPARERAESGPLLDVRDLTVDYMTPRGPARAVDHVSLALAPGEVLGLAGESGCGKSTLAFAVTRLIKPPGLISGGQIIFRGRDVLTLSPNELRAFRWGDVSIVFQSAMNALNPVLNLGAQLADTIMAHDHMSKGQALERAAELFALVGLDRARLRSFPHELSGGMRQRAVIAIALALNPPLVVLDEPTTALDVVVQRDILQQIQDLQARFGFSILFITHDLSLLVEFSDRIAIMYAGKIAELATAETLFRDPKHPYTVGLMNSFPSLSGEKRKMQGIPGAPPDLVTPPAGCRFAPRCPHALVVCRQAEPPLRLVAPGQRAACHLYDEKEEVPHAPGD